MQNSLKLSAVILTFGCIACTTKAPIQTFKQQVSLKSASPIISGNAPYQQMRQKLAAVVITNNGNFNSWAKNNFAIKYAPSDSYGGSAAPISEDGYFLTANHVISQAYGKGIYIIYSDAGKITATRARVVWKSYSSDLALLHIPQRTSHYYQWSSVERGLPKSQSVYHGGMRWRDTLGPQENAFSKRSLIYGWNPESNGSSKGNLITDISPENSSEGDRKFKMNIRVMPGDSGGPIVDPNGRLIGINSSVEFFGTPEKPIFIDSIGVRPSPQKINEIIRKDRA